jgi:Transcriptional Coactivator p15 (PC4)
MDPKRPRKMRLNVQIKPFDTQTLPMETYPSTPPGQDNHDICEVAQDLCTIKLETQHRLLPMETQPSTPPIQNIPVCRETHAHHHNPELTAELRRFEIVKNRFLIHSLYRGDVKIHIRQFDPFPSKIGVCFTPLRLAAFRAKLGEIEEGVKLLRAGRPVDIKIHIGGQVYVTIQSGYFLVNIRKYYTPENQADEMPTRCGIALKLNEWDKLNQCLAELLRVAPEIRSAQPCYMSFNHADIITMMDCEECNPLASWMHNKD